MSNTVMVNHKNSNELILNQDAMQSIQIFAQAMAGGTVTVPKHLQGNPADCLAITMQAVQWGMSPFVVAQKTHVVSGNLGYEAQLVNAVVMNSGAIDGRFHYQYGGGWPSGSDAWVMCGAIPSGESEIQWGEPLYPANVSTKNSPLWKTNPKQQAAYLAVKYWARMYCPGAILGVYSVDELEQMPERDVTPQREESAIDAIMAKAEQAKDLDGKGFNILHDAITQSANMEDFGEAMEKVSKSSASEDQKAELRKAATAKKKELTNPKPQTFDDFK